MIVGGTGLSGSWIIVIDFGPPGWYDQSVGRLAGCVFYQVEPGKEYFQWLQLDLSKKLPRSGLL